MILPELIGIEARVVRAKASSLVGLRGLIVDYTKNLLVLATRFGEKKIQKGAVELELKLNGWIRLPGRALVRRPEELIIL